MDCDEVNLLLMDYIDGELSLEMNLVIENHMKGCDVCRIEWEETKNILEDVRKISHNIHMDSEVKMLLKEELLQELRIYRNTSPFLSGLHRKKEEISIRVKDKRSLTGNKK